MGDLRAAIKEEMSWGVTENGQACKVTTANALLDMFGRAGAMRNSSVEDRRLMFNAAYNENADAAVKLLFYVRDIRGGYGERDTFAHMLRELAMLNRESVAKNLWAVMEFGYAKDLYSLIGTEAEDDMWAFMKNQFEMDYENMKAGKSISLLAKWIATPDSKSEKTREIGKLTAKKLGYSFKTMSDYKRKLREMRKYLDLPEAKMCAGKWNEIEYSKCASKFMLKNRNALREHDKERYEEFFKKVESGEAKLHTDTLTPVDIVHSVRENYTPDLETTWKALKDVCEHNALVIADTSGSMSWHCSNGVYPLEVAQALAIYFAQRNKGNLKDLFMTFSDNPEFVEVNRSTLRDNLRVVEQADWDGSTNLEAAFDLLLKTAKNGKLANEDMPEALVIVSDMQINCVDGLDSDHRMTFYEVMKERYEAAGYKMPHVVFWNVQATKPTFHATVDTAGVSMVSGWSVNVFKQVMENIGTTPLDLLNAVLTSDRYKDIVA